MGKRWAGGCTRWASGEQDMVKDIKRWTRDGQNVARDEQKVDKRWARDWQRLGKRCVKCDQMMSKECRCGSGPALCSGRGADTAAIRDPFRAPATNFTES